MVISEDLHVDGILQLLKRTQLRDTQTRRAKCNTNTNTILKTLCRNIFITTEPSLQTEDRNIESLLYSEIPCLLLESSCRLWIHMKFHNRMKTTIPVSNITANTIAIYRSDYLPTNTFPWITEKISKRRFEQSSRCVKFTQCPNTPTNWTNPNGSVNNSVAKPQQCYVIWKNINAENSRARRETHSPLGQRRKREPMATVTKCVLCLSSVML